MSCYCCCCFHCCVGPFVGLCANRDKKKCLTVFLLFAHTLSRSLFTPQPQTAQGEAPDVMVNAVEDDESDQWARQAAAALFGGERERERESEGEHRRQKKNKKTIENPSRLTDTVSRRANRISPACRPPAAAPRSFVRVMHSHLSPHPPPPLTDNRSEKNFTG